MTTARLAIVLPILLFISCGRPQGGEGPRQQVRVTTDPPGARISCDGVPYDTAPLTLADIEPGEHLIVATLEGHREARKTFALLRGQRTAVDLKLDPLFGLVLIHSSPSGAEVTVDGAFRGTTPLLLPDFPLGGHRLRLEREGSLPKEIDLTVNDRVPRKVDVNLASDAARVHVDSEPPGASVSLDGVQKGVTPVDIEDVPSGESHLQVILEGYQPFLETLVLTAGDERTIRAVLKPQLGGLRVVSLPTGARVYVDNEFKGKAPLTVSGLVPGSHRLRVEAPGYEADARTIEVDGRDEKVEEFRMVKNSGLVVLTTAPAGVKVFVDGSDRGVTPGNEGAPVSDPLQIDLLKEGRHILQLSKAGYATATKSIGIKANQVLTMHEELSRLFIPDTEVRIGTGAGEVRRGVLLDQSPNGDVKLEVRPGVIVEIKAGDILEIKPLTAP